MDVTSANNSNGKDEKSEASSSLDFFLLVGKIKTALRTGWTHYNIRNVESVSDHMYRMSLITMLLHDKEGFDKTRAMKIALVHDLAECIVGDITPYCGVSPEEKHQREADAMKKITTTIPNQQVAKEITELWEEYNKQETMEARAVKDIDRFEMILQAYEYEKSEERPGDLERFYETTAGKFRNDQVKSWVSELNTRRLQFKTESIQSRKDS